MHQLWHITRWVFLALALAYIALVIYAYPHDHQVHLDAAAVPKIQSQKITIADVDGSNLPPPPDPTLVNSTVAGIDANENGIRDDVELAIFAEYPTSSATSTAVRAAELQYAMGLQEMIMKVFDSETWIAAAVQLDRGYQCVGETYPRTDLQKYNQVTDALTNEVEGLEFNTPSRKTAEGHAFDFTTSYALPDNNFCDVDPSTF